MVNRLVSVIMSTHNTDDRFLKESVGSILRQSYKNIELILIVDGGRKNDCLAEFKDKRMRVIAHRDSLGLAARLNEGFLLAKGDYVARMDSDDYSLPNRISDQVRFMESNKSIDICSTFAKQFGSDDKYMINPNISDEYISSQLFFSNAIIHPTVMFRSKSIRKHQIRYNASFKCSQDYELWSRLSDHCRFAIVPKLGLMYRVHGEQITSKKKSEQAKYYREAIKGNYKRLGICDFSVNYAEALCGRDDSISIDGLILFVQNCLSWNDKSGVYDSAVFRKLLYRRLFIECCRKNLFLKGLKFFNTYVVLYSFRKKYYRLKCKRQLRNNRQYMKELKRLPADMVNSMVR